MFFAHARRLARIDLNFDASGGSDDSGNTGRTTDEARGDDAKYIFISWLPWDFPLLAHVYPRISLPRSPKVVVVDMFGVLLVSLTPAVDEHTLMYASPYRTEKVLFVTLSNDGSLWLAVG